MKHLLSGLWLLTTISGVGCAVGSAADLGGDVLATPPAEGERGDAASGSEPVALGAEGGANPKTDAGGPKADAGGELGEGGTTPGACAFSGELVSFDLAKVTGTPVTVTATATAPGIVVTALKRVGVSATSSSGAMNASSWPTGALDPNKHFAFSVSAPAGCKLAAATLSIDLTASSTGPTQAAVGTSVDGYAQLENVALGAAGGASIALAGISGASGPVEIHVFGFAADAATGTLRIQNTLALTGTVGN